MDRSSPWPSLPVEEWAATRDTLQLWTQVVGKVRLAHTPLVNHWWNVPLYVTARGLTTSLVSPASGPAFQIDLDLVTHRLVVTTTDGATSGFVLEAGPVGGFYRSLLAVLDGLGLATSIWPVPVEIEGAVPFERDDRHGAYDPQQAHRFWLLLVEAVRVLAAFRSRFVGKCSPVHLFWGSLDLAVTRFSGRPAPPYRGHVPNCGPAVMLEAYSHKVSSCGYWPGGEGEGLFYSYAYPEPGGFRAAAVAPAAARYDEPLGEFVLPYEAVRTASDPDAALLAFWQSTYDAAADLGRWDRAALERPPPGRDGGADD